MNIKALVHRKEKKSPHFYMKYEAEKQTIFMLFILLYVTNLFCQMNTETHQAEIISMTV